MITEFGILLRKTRIDNDEYMKNMACKLKTSVAYLSAVELGKRNVPFKWIMLISIQYNIDYTIIENAYLNSKRFIKINLVNMEPKTKELVLTFFRYYRYLTICEIKQISSILNNKKTKEN